MSQTKSGEDRAINAAQFDPRNAPIGSPLGMPPAWGPYPNTGSPYPNPNPLPAPAITGIVPARTNVGGVGMLKVVMTGTGFLSTSVVLRNGQPVEKSTYVSPTSLSVYVDLGKFTTPQDVAVTVINPDGQVSNATTFKFQPKP